MSLTFSIQSTQPALSVTIKIWPSGWVCHAERAPSSNVTEPTEILDGSFAANNGSTRTARLKYCSAPLFDGCAPLRVMTIDDGCEVGSFAATHAHVTMPTNVAMVTTRII